MHFPLLKINSGKNTAGLERHIGAGCACEYPAALLQAGAGQSADARREWANAVLEALRTQSKLPGQASLPPPMPGKGPAQNPDASSPSGAQNPSASSSAGPHAAAQPGMCFVTHPYHLRSERAPGKHRNNGRLPCTSTVIVSGSTSCLTTLCKHCASAHTMCSPQ